MSDTATSLPASLTVLFWIITSAAAQTSHFNQFRIEIQSQGSLPANYSVQLIDSNQHNTVSTVYSDGLGGFSFQSVPEGQYIARLVDSAGRTVGEDIVCVDGVAPVIRINPPAQPSSPRPAGDLVSARQLQHPPSKNAVKAFHDARKYSDAKQYQKAAAALEKAVELSPDFAEAHTNLAAEYLHLGRYEQAVRETQLAMQIASPNVRDLVNCALGEWALNRRADALRLAQRALDLDRGSLTANFVSGSLLAMNPATLPEGIRRLEIAADKIPAAAQNLAKARELAER
jgi:tetratricopeptide (TPR) repeat protein